MTRSERSTLGGTFFEPTVLSDVTTDRVITNEKIFGLWRRSIAFKTDDDAIAMANDNAFGLAAYLRRRGGGIVAS